MGGNQNIEELILRSLQQQVTEEEQAILQQWLDTSPENRQEYEALARIWDRSASALQQQSFDPGAAWEQIQPRLQPGPYLKPTPRTGVMAVRFDRKKLWIAASTLLILLAAGWWYYRENGRRSSLVIVAQTADHRITLPDSTVAWLRKGASLQYVEGVTGGKRTLELKGEAFFEVMPHRDRPFTVVTAHALIEDLGTSFLVRDKDTAGDTTVEVMVTKGRVKVTDREQLSVKVVVNAGEMAILRQNGFIIDRITDSNFLSWRTRVLEFNHTSFTRVLQDIQALYGNPIVLTPGLQAEADTINITARFENQPLREVLDEIKLMTGFEIKEKKDTLFLYNK